MFGTSGPGEVSYANAALTIALLKHLTDAKIITPEGAEDVYRDAIKILSAIQGNISVAKAVDLIRQSFAPPGTNI